MKKLEGNIIIDLTKGPHIAQTVQDFNLDILSVVNQALTLFEWALEEKMLGREIFSSEKNGTLITNLKIDFLEKVEKLNKP